MKLPERLVPILQLFPFAPLVIGLIGLYLIGR